jgi:hypothetical protein
MEKFAKDSEGKYYNERLEIEINKRKAFSESRSNNRTGKTKEAKKHMKNKSKTYVNHMENENRDINKDKKESETEKTPLQKKFDEFLQFRKAMKKTVLKESIPALKKHLYQLAEGNDNKAMQIIDQSIANGYQGLFELKESANKKQSTEPNHPLKRID